ncbi:MAG TPA: PKD domain-containing protein [Planctomycetota bacterium]|nr:PKD domain-containing protein [Planctomycetota bacterium]
MRGLKGAFLAISLAVVALAAPAPPAFDTPAAPDLLFFSKKVAPDLQARCSGCHSDPQGAGGKFLLEPIGETPDPEAVIRNFRSALAELEPHDPARSKLLLRALGDGHPAGAVYASRSAPDYETLLHFAMGATLDNRPPEAIVEPRREIELGKEVVLDGALSADPDGQALAYRWEVVDRPAGSRAQLRDAEGNVARLSPDVAGAYRVELRVTDGALWSLPASVAVGARAPDTRTSSGTPSTKQTFTDRALDAKRLRLIRRLFLDLKWRSPRLEEIAQWYDTPHPDMVRAFLSDEETWTAWFEGQLYYFLLLDSFRPKEGPLTTIPARLAKGEVSVPRAVEEIVRSQYFNARNPGNDTFVTVVLEQCLGMTVQERRNIPILEAGKRMYDGYKAKVFKEEGNSQADFVRIVFAQADLYRHLLRRTWKDLHGTDIDPKRLEESTAACLARPEGFATLLEEWLLAPEYVDGAQKPRPKAEIPYVRALFLDTLDRLPAYDELRNVRNAFLSLADPTPIRLVMGRVLLESNEARIPASAVDPSRFVDEQFVRLLARPPTADERGAFVRALKSDPSVTPRLVLLTLITSPEYQGY